MRKDIILYIIYNCILNTINAVKYEFDPRIHNFGNVGLGGKFYASVARPVTRIIDRIAYKGVNVRKDIIKTLNLDPNIVSDWCCGTGMSTDALYDSFTNAEIYGVDTSKEMLNVAHKQSFSNAEFLLGNVEDIILPKTADLITIMFAFHEIPQYARLNILKNVKKNLSHNGRLLIVDIDICYEPSKIMLSGEPYIEDYLSNVRDDIRSIFPKVIEKTVIPKRVLAWYSEPHISTSHDI